MFSQPFWKELYIPFCSWDEMTKHDLDASIDYVLKKTGQKSVYYVGHSQGTEIMFSKLAVDAKFAQKIRQFHALAPVATVKNIQGFMRFVADHLFFETEVMMDIFGRDKFMPDTGILNMWAEKYCYDVSFVLRWPQNFRIIFFMYRKIWVESVTFN